MANMFFEAGRARGTCTGIGRAYRSHISHLEYLVGALLSSARCNAGKAAATLDASCARKPTGARVAINTPPASRVLSRMRCHGRIVKVEPERGLSRMGIEAGMATGDWGGEVTNVGGGRAVRERYLISGQHLFSARHARRLDTPGRALSHRTGTFVKSRQRAEGAGFVAPLSVAVQCVSSHPPNSPRTAPGTDTNSKGISIMWSPRPCQCAGLYSRICSQVLNTYRLPIARTPRRRPPSHLGLRCLRKARLGPRRPSPKNWDASSVDVEQAKPERDLRGWGSSRRWRWRWGSGWKSDELRRSPHFRYILA
ncbi:hypothetical protein B0H11DRAFT_2295587 [Mycena galericulata]|nr:hypothetical protein B0H11DRAFT_2295587 [Mycena galericulata]